MTYEEKAIYLSELTLQSQMESELIKVIEANGWESDDTFTQNALTSVLVQLLEDYGA